MKYIYKLFPRLNSINIFYNKYFLVLNNKLDNTFFLIHNDLELNKINYKYNYFLLLFLRICHFIKKTL